MPAVPADALYHVLSYDADGVDEWAPGRLEDARPAVGRRAVTWINVNTAKSADALRALEQAYGIHPLTIEDVQNTRQRPKVEVYEGYVYVVIQMLAREPGGRIETEQMSLILGTGWLITVQERPGDIFGPVRDRIRQGRPRVRASQADYLLYALMDAVVDAWFPIVESLGDDLEELEDEALRGASIEVRERIARIRRDLLTLRRVAWPQRDSLGNLERGEVEWVRPATRPFFRDLADHVTRVIDFVETNRELAANVMDIHQAGVAQRTNDVVKVLTVVTSIFIPLTFIVGVYGMNFRHMPELAWPWAYPALLSAMGLLALAMLALFRRRGWI